MRTLSLCGLSLILAGVICVSPSGVAQSNQPALVLEILGFKVGNNYNPLLERQPAVFSADNPDRPQTEAEKVVRRNDTITNNPATTRRNTPAPIAPGETKPRPAVRLIDAAEWVTLSIRNTSDKAIRSIVWDFAFPRYENNAVVLRFDVNSKADIKPGGKKTIKQKLPPGAKRCQIINAAETVPMDLVCGQGFLDPSGLKQEAVSIRRIEYADGSVWPR
ncbi:MAG: hypothetical protein ACKV2V_29840 [Blastocatellia bacterium]